MASTYQGKPVTIVRSARKDDDGYEDGEDQVVIKLEDGTQQVVARTEVQDTKQQQGGGGQQQR